MSLTVSYGCLLSLTVFNSSIEFLHASHCLLLLLAFSHCLSDPMELLHVHHCLSLILAVCHCPHGVAACLYQTLMVARCLSLPLLVVCSCLHVSHRLI